MWLLRNFTRIRIVEKPSKTIKQAGDQFKLKQLTVKLEKNVKNNNTKSKNSNTT